MIEIMKEVMSESPAITLKGNDYNGDGDDYPIYWDDIRKSPIGTQWSARCGNSW